MVIRPKLIVVLVAGLLAAVSPAVADAAPLAGNSTAIQDEFVASATWQPTAMDFTSDGYALVASKLGRVERLNLDTGAVSSYVSLPNAAYLGERGLIDILVDSGTDEVFLYRSLTDSRLVIDRFTYTGNATADRASLTRVWSNPGPLHSEFGTNHLGGGLAFGAGSTLFVSIGDGELPANSQDLTNVFGKVLRINRDGTIPTNNPFYDGAGPNIDEIWAYGLRNPFRMWSGADNKLWLGDVGGNDHSIAYEEIHVVQSGANYGWPMCQGPNSQPKNGPACPTGVTEPLYSWAHPPDPEISYFGSAVAVGEVLGTDVPDGLKGALVYADYANGRIEYLNFNADGSVAASEVLTETGRHPVWLGRAPNGYLYYIHFDFVEGQSQIRRLRLSDHTQSGISIGPIQASATAGPAPLTVSFSAQLTGDLDNAGNLTYIWDFGDGTSSNQVAPTHIFSANGDFQVRLTVTTTDSINFSEPIQITVGAVPVPVITAGTTIFNAGDTLFYSGTSTGGVGNVDLTWDLVFDHDSHSHPVVTAHQGSTFNFVVPTTGHDWAGNTSYRVVLTAEDSEGLKSSTELTVQPRRVEISIGSTFSGAQFTLDGEVLSTPTVIQTIVGFNHTLSVVGLPGLTFDQWSDGAPATRVLVVPNNNLSLEMQFLHLVADANSIDQILTASDYNRNGAEVLRLYRAVFGREPDLGGAKYWIGINQQGLSVDDIAFYFADSKEFKLRFGAATTNTEFLNVVYLNTLDRSPDSVGAAYWLNLMNNGLPRHLVVRWFAGSQEFANKYGYGYSY